jgi:hypothetical protein
MYAKWRVSSILVVLIIISLIAQITVGIQPVTAPKVRPDAPTKIILDEDSLPYYLDLYDIYDITDAPLNFTVWDGTSWGSSYETPIITAVINTNDTIVFTPKPNMFGADTVKLNATNLYEMNTHYNLTVSISPVNDAPVIEMIGNVKVNDTDFVKFFLYEDEWFNVTVYASDIDGDTPVFFDNAPEFDIDYLTGEISFFPTDEIIGDIYRNITVSDINGTNSEDWITVQFTIMNVNDPPTAKIISPENDSYFYYYDYIYFEGMGTDPDVEHGDFLYYEWYSDQDGLLGTGDILEWVYLSKGEHQITLIVIDSEGLYDTDTITIYYEGDPYEEYHYIFMSLVNNTLLIKQNEKATCQAKVENWGYSEDTVFFEIKKYFDFPGEVEFEIENLTLDEYESAIVNLTISVPADTEIGFYPVDLYARPDVDYDDYYYKYWWEDVGIDTLYIYVISNQTGDSDKQAIKPNWNVGDYWQYSLDADEDYVSMQGTVQLEVAKDTYISQNNERYEAYLLELDSDLEMKYVYEYDDYNPEVDVEMSGDYYYRKSDLATIQDTGIIEMSMTYYGDTSYYKTTSNSTYDPPAIEYKFPLQTGAMWTVNTEVTSVTLTQYDDDYDDYTERDKEITEEISYKICLGTKTVTTEAGTFETYLIVEYYHESEEIYNDYDDDYPEPPPKEGGTHTRSKGEFVDFGDPNDIYLDYYSPEVNYTVKGVHYSQIYNYDYYENWTSMYDWDEVMTIELTDYELVTPSEDPNEPDEPDENITDPNDKDDDGLPDDWEDEYDTDDPDEDSDGDGYSNLEEFESGTNPVDKDDTPADPIDTDEDGLPDAYELFYGLDPSDPDDAYYDSDNDGVNNLKEYKEHTSPTDPDDYPEIGEESDEPSESEGIFGLGKVGDLDLFYIYLLILIIIIILVVVAGVVKHRKSRRSYAQPMPDQRIEEEPVPTPVMAEPVKPGPGTAPKQPTMIHHDKGTPPPAQTPASPQPRIRESPPQAAPFPPPLPPPPPGYEQYGYSPYEPGYNQPYRDQYQNNYYGDQYDPRPQSQYYYRNRRPPSGYY